MKPNHHASNASVMNRSARVPFSSCHALYRVGSQSTHVYQNMCAYVATQNNMGITVWGPKSR